MHAFILRFAFCNIFLFLFVGILAAVRKLSGSRLSGSMQYNLWLLLFPVLFLPFLPIRLSKNIFSFLQMLLFPEGSPVPAASLKGEEAYGSSAVKALAAVKDFALQAEAKESLLPFLLSLLSLVWIAGMAVTAVYLLRSFLRLRQLKACSLPLRDNELLRVYHACLAELKIKRKLPLRLAPGLRSPAITGLFCPVIFLPARLSDTYLPREIRYMLLHELQHYRRRDALANHLANVCRILYWFHPAVRYWLSDLRTAREIACDTSVLLLLEENEHKAYGSTLIRFAEELSASPSPLWSGISGNMRQMQRRIRNIADFRPHSCSRRLWERSVFLLTAAVLSVLSPVMAAGAAGGELPAEEGISADPAKDRTCHFDRSGKRIIYPDLSPFFDGYDGCFVLYRAKDDTFMIYNEDAACRRISPASTYKIYDALLGLEEGIISPDASFLSWDGKAYPFPEWEADQNLDSAMEYSVNWYFQRIDAEAGMTRVQSFLERIAYGNQTAGNQFAGNQSVKNPSAKAAAMENAPAQYWMDGTLRISPAEQVELLEKFYHGRLPVSLSSVNAVKDAICLKNDASGSLYGKTGTIRSGDKDVSGWFIGYTEQGGNPCFFATNIQGRDGAAGSRAYEITCSVLDELSAGAAAFCP